MVEDAEKSGALKPGATIIELTSDNTGVGLAMVAAVKGYKLVLVMPDSMSVERLRLILAYGSSFDLTPRALGIKGAIARAQELMAATPGAWMPQRFEEPRQHRSPRPHHRAGNPGRLSRRAGRHHHRRGHRRPHYRCSAGAQSQVAGPEGVCRRSPAKPGDIRRRALAAPDPGHWRGLYPQKLHTALLDGVIQVDAEPAREMARRSAAEEGILVGISSGATLAAIAQKLPELPAGAKVLGFNYDTGERHLSIEGFLPSE